MWLRSNAKPTTRCCESFCGAEREAVLAVLEGLDEADWHRPVVPTGWTPAGMLEHLGGAEWHWFQGVVAGKEPELQGDPDEDQPPYDPLTVIFATDEPSTEVIAFYRDQCAQSEAVLATPPSGRAHGQAWSIRATECSLDRVAHDRRDGATCRAPGHGEGAARRHHPTGRSVRHSRPRLPLAHALVSPASSNQGVSNCVDDLAVVQWSLPR